MKEILGGCLDKAFEELKINAKKTYEGNTRQDRKTQIWEMTDDDYEKICDIKDEDWKDDWGWWRGAEGSNMFGNPISRYNINNHYIKAWDGDGRIEALKEVNGNTSHDDYCWMYDRKFKNLLEYMCNEIGASQPRNVCALAVDLAKINGIKMSELFHKYQGIGEKIKWMVKQNYYTFNENNNNFETDDFDELRDFLKEELCHLTSKTKEEIYDEIFAVEYLDAEEIIYFNNENNEEILSVKRIN